MSEDSVDDRAAVAERAARAGGAVAEGHFRRDVPVRTKSGKTDVVTRADHEAQRQVITTVRDEFPEDAIVGEERVEQRSTERANGQRPRAADELEAVPEAGPTWVVDPIDGTNNFVRGTRLWTTSVAAVRDGEAVAAANVMPALGDVYTADEDGAFLDGDPVTVSDRTDPERFTVAPTMWWSLDRRDEYGRACREIVERFGDLRRYGSAQAVLSMVASGALEAVVTNVDAHPWDTVAGAFMVERAGGVVTDLDGERWRHDSRGLVASNGEAHEEVLAAARAIDGESG